MTRMKILEWIIFVNLTNFVARIASRMCKEQTSLFWGIERK